MKTSMRFVDRFHPWGTVVLGACFASQVWAVDGNGDFAVDGGGGRNCAAFTQAAKKRNTDFYLFAGWVDGYVTANNQHAKDTYDYTPWQTTEFLLAALGQYCEKNPNQPFIVAVNGMLSALKPDRLQAKSEMMMVQTNMGGIALYKATIEAIQHRLADQKLYAGPQDGNFTATLKDAVRAFQLKSNLPATGLPDQLTLNRLFSK